MYDEWSATHTNLRSVNRARSRSILQSVALQGDGGHIPRRLPQVPQVTVIRRVKTVSDLGSLKDLPQSFGSVLYPFSYAEQKQLNDLSEWYKDELDIENLYDDIDYANDLKYISFIENCQIQSHDCNKLIHQSDAIIARLDELAIGFDYVRQETSKFQSSCDTLVRQEHHLKQLSLDVDANLEIFASLDSITRQLNAPGSKIVVKSTFKQLLQDLDIGIEYLEKNTFIIDHSLYQLRFHQCMVRALTLIQEYVSNKFKSLVRQVEGQLEGKGGYLTTGQQALLYAKFKTEAPLINSLVSEISSRSAEDSQYEHLYTESVQSWFSTRQKLIHSIIGRKVDDYSKDSRDVVQLARSCLSFYKETRAQELQLFNAFFPLGRPEFEMWIVKLFEPLYNLLRQRVIRESSIDNLCELTSMLLSFETEHEDISHKEDDEDNMFVKQVLYDTQGRLVFRVQAYIDAELVRYVPKPEDLNVLSHRKRKTAKASIPEESTEPPDESQQLDTAVAQHTVDTLQLLDGWYPPLRKAINLLSQIYQLVRSRVFDDLAHTIIHECIRSLTKVHQLATTRLGALEAQLFLLKHLLMLQTQIMEFDIDTAPTEIQIDFSGIQEVFNTVRQEGISFSSTNLLNMARVGAPRVIHDMVDAKQELYAHLKNCIHDFTEGAVKSIVYPILGDPQPAMAQEDTRKLRQNASVELPRIRRMIETYIEDVRTIDILIDSIQDLVIQTYGEYYKKIVFQAKNRQEIEDVMELDGLISWLSEIVGQLYKSRHNSIAESLSVRQ